MAKRSKITEAQSQQIIDMRVDKSYTCQRIANKLDLSYGAVYWHLLKLGIEKGGEPPKHANHGIHKSGSYQRKGYTVRTFTPEEDRQLTAYSMQGLTTTKIAKLMNRRHNSISARLYTLARRDERLEAHT